MLVGFEIKDIYLVCVTSALVKVTIRGLILSFQCQLAISDEQAAFYGESPSTVIKGQITRSRVIFTFTYLIVCSTHCRVLHLVGRGAPLSPPVGSAALCRLHHLGLQNHSYLRRHS